MPKKASSKQELLSKKNMETLASVTKEMRQPRKTESVRQEEITHLHINLQRRRAS